MKMAGRQIDSAAGRAEAETRLRELEEENARLRAALGALSGDPDRAAADQQAEEFRGLADHIPQLVWLADRSGRLYWCNRRWYDYTGILPQEMEGGGWGPVCHPAHAERVMALFAEAVAAGRPWEAACPLRGRSGEYRWFLSRAMPIRDGAGQIVRWCGAHTDITEQMETETALREAEEARRLATEGAGLGSWHYQPQTGELRWDARCRALIGLKPDGEVTMERFLERVHEEDRARVLENVRAALENGEDCRYENEYRVTDPETGETRWIASVGRAWFEDGAPARMVGTVRDVTERKIADHNQALLINELNHRVKNTLTTVQAVAARTLRSASTPDEAREALTARLLALSKAHDILTAEHWEGADMEDMVRAALAPYRDAMGERLSMQGGRLRISPKKALALSMALHELATNAIKYGALSAERGRVEIAWESRGESPARRLTLVWRESGGPPVSPPTRTGFGTRLIKHGLAGQLNARVEMDYRPEGLCCAIDAPLLHVDRKTPR